jgi:hypothetical protein
MGWTLLDSQEVVDAVVSDELKSVNEIVAEAQPLAPESGVGVLDVTGEEDETPEPEVDSAKVEIPVEPTVEPAEPPNNPPAWQPVETPGVRQLSRMKFTPLQLVPSFKGNCCSYTVTQLQSGVLYPGLYMVFMQHMSDEAHDVVVIILTQLSMKVDLKEWGEDAKKAVFDEMKRLRFQKTSGPKHWNKLTKEQKAWALEAHLFLKQKLDGMIKGRAVIGGNKQQDYFWKEDASSPTATMESVLLTDVIAAEECCDVAVVGIPNAFIQTRVECEEDKVIIWVWGCLVDVFCKINPTFKKSVMVNMKGEKQLLLQCENAIHSMLMTSLLFYNTFIKILKWNRFKLIPYNPCIENQMVDEKQQTCVFHVDDCILMANLTTNDEIIETLQGE